MQCSWLTEAPRVLACHIPAHPAWRQLRIWLLGLAFCLGFAQCGTHESLVYKSERCSKRVKR